METVLENNTELFNIKEYENAGINKSLQERFGVPPFSILDTKQGYWQDRKRLWLSLGIKSELGRDCKVYKIGDAKTYLNTRAEADKRSNLNNVAVKPEWATGTGTTNMAPGTSIFDPVLTEIMYRWFCTSNGSILDPFAGGSVRGIVASKLGYQYTGIELSSKQVEANLTQAEVVCEDDNIITWRYGDSNKILEEYNKETFDFIFSCPPYYDLEVYSDLPEDLSNMPYEQFMETYHSIIAKSVKLLKDNRFACFVIADVRDKKGFYRNLVSETINGFLKAGMKLYNEIILVNTCGSLPIRISKQFNGGRKIGKQHQNVLVFYKGDVKFIKENYQNL